MASSVEEIKRGFGNKLIGGTRMKNLVAETLAKLPQETVDFAVENIWFVSSFDDSWGFVIDSKDLGSKHLIFLSDELFDQDSYAQHYTVAHEIGHVVLNHRNAFLAPQTKAEIAKQEKEAHQFALKYIK